MRSGAPLFLQYRLTRDEGLHAWRRASVCATVTAEDAAVIRRCTPGADMRVGPDGAPLAAVVQMFWHVHAPGEHV
jgi:hypothetical protein